MFSKFDICYPNKLKSTISSTHTLIFRTYNRSNQRVCVFKVWNFIPTWAERDDFRYYKFDIPNLQQIKSKSLCFRSLKFVTQISWKVRFQVLKLWYSEPVTGQIYVFVFSKFKICYPNKLNATISGTPNLIFRAYNRSSLRVCVFKVWDLLPK